MTTTPIAAHRLMVSGKALEYGIPDRLFLLRVMRQRMVEDLRRLVPTARIHFVFSKAAPSCFDLTGIVSEDDGKALKLATKMRTTRRQWQGYRTDLDFWEDSER